MPQSPSTVVPPGWAPLDTMTGWTHPEIRKRGVRTLTESLGEMRGVVLENHGRPTAVMLLTEEYARLRDLARMALEGVAALPDPLDQLRARFDERLAQLQRRGAPERVDAAFEAHTRGMGLRCEPPMLAG